MTARRIYDLTLPLNHNDWATLSSPFPLTEMEWAQMMVTLGAMKPGLVTPAEAAPDDE